MKTAKYSFKSDSDGWTWDWRTVLCNIITSEETHKTHIVPISTHSQSQRWIKRCWPPTSHHRSSLPGMNKSNAPSVCSFTDWTNLTWVLQHTHTLVNCQRVNQSPLCSRNTPLSREDGAEHDGRSQSRHTDRPCVCVCVIRKMDESRPRLIPLNLDSNREFWCFSTETDSVTTFVYSTL